MSLNLGMEALVDNKSTEDVDAIDVAIASEELTADMFEAKQLLNAFQSFTSVCDTIKQHGGYAGFESLIAEKAQLDQILGVDICSASVEQVADLYSNEILRDSINKFLTKVNAALGRAGDRIANFIKTTLPFKEKYLKEMTELKQMLVGKKFDEAKFADQKVASALDKGKYNEYIAKHKELLTAIGKFSAVSSADNIEKFIQAADDVPDATRTSVGTFYQQPWKSWFTTATVKSLGYTSKDVLPVIDKAIASIKSIEELRTTYSKMNEQFNRLTVQISHDRAEGKVDEAIAKRESVARLQEFFFQICEAAFIYDTMIRREMYFATYLGRALKKCIVA